MTILVILIVRICGVHLTEEVRVVRISCPNCDAVYSISESRFPSSAKHITCKCVKCEHLLYILWSFNSAKWSFEYQQVDEAKYNATRSRLHYNNSTGRSGSANPTLQTSHNTQSHNSSANNMLSTSYVSSISTTAIDKQYPYINVQLYDNISSSYYIEYGVWFNSCGIVFKIAKQKPHIFIARWLEIAEEWDRQHIYNSPLPEHEKLRRHALIEAEANDVTSYTYEASADNFEIQFENIQWYECAGDVQYHTEISGGGTKDMGVNVAGAIVGGLLFGAVGAILGGKGKIETDPIRTETIEYDNRYTIIQAKVEGTIRNYTFHGLGLYNLLLQTIPEKDINTITRNAMLGKPQVDYVQQLKELAELKDKGIITEEEFRKTKEELLSRI